MPETIHDAHLDHVAVAVSDLADTMTFLTGALGGRPAFGGPGRGFTGAQWEFAGGARIEAIAPTGEGREFLDRFLAAHGPGIHHVTFKVPELAAAAEAARSHGYEPVGYDDSNPGWKECFLHPKQALGIVVQIAESHPELDGEWGAGWDFPPAPPRPPEPVRVVALRMTCPDEASALRQWRDLLGGRLGHDAAGLVFSWPESPLRICVSIDPARSPGALAIEVASDRPLEAATRPSPVVGARFVVVEASAT